MATFDFNGDEFEVGDWALHINNQLDEREVVAVENGMIRLSIFGSWTPEVPAANYERLRST